MAGDDTAEQSWSRAGIGTPPSRPRPGAIKVFAAGAACFVPRALERAHAVIGRDAACDLVSEDARMSRRHSSVRFDGESWRVHDLGSRNGTFLDGAAAPHIGGRRGVLATGDTLFLLCDDVRPYLAESIEVTDGIVVGPTLRRAWRDIERAARVSPVVHLTGETGAGKELASRRFHDAGPRARGPLVAVNCATLPATIAERLLFGARRGAYSGADSDADGYLAAADGGTLFLDEVAELPLEVQAKLLRVVEDGALWPLGAARPRRVDLGIVTATHGDLRAQVAAGRFRDDLYFRLGKPVVALPALRDRLEDVAFLIECALARLAPPRRPHASLVEAALRRAWPGNVRELVREIAAAAGAAPDAERVRAEHLDARAGCPLGAALQPGDDVPRIRDALARERGNVSRAARALGMHRNQLRRWLARTS
ncbi:MAG TPA: sigma 54-interacting transcriptional regulator [Kofleriaceae bacterium]|nr:sigma 54-interacting transcriptional regulator [Kofleriaceae bacterium]